MGKMFCDAMEAEVICVMGAMGTLPTLIFLGSFLMLTQMDAKIVVLGKCLGTDIASKRA